MSAIQAIGLIVFILGALCGVAWALAWLFELPGFERDPGGRERHSWDDWDERDVDEETRRWEQPGDE
jgi:hypothetical protein